MLKQAVRRNIERFPPDFMFELIIEDFKNWRSQFVTSNADKIEKPQPSKELIR
ncbi:MAG: ORF6N domain-containing protein [Pseudomonadota bacterium]